MARKPDYELELEILAGGLHPCGVDEAGRGPLAGSVVAAAVMLDPANVPQGLDDSKKVSPRRRETLFAEIMATAAVGIAAVGSEEIDATDIRKATLLAMRTAVEALPRRPGFALIDGRDVPPGLPCGAKAVVSGDSISASVAAASIVAKVTRDRMLAAADEDYPGYGFSAHSGYGTKAHLEAIARLGPCPIHRMSFRPLKAA